MRWQSDVFPFAVDAPLVSSLIRTQNQGAVRESLNMSGLQNLRILTLVLFVVVVAVDAGSNIPQALLSIGTCTYGKQIVLSFIFAH